MEPAVVKGFFIFVWTVQITLGDIGTPDNNFTSLVNGHFIAIIVEDFHFDTSDRSSGGTKNAGLPGLDSHGVVVGFQNSQDWRGFREPVALLNFYPFEGLNGFFNPFRRHGG